VDFWALTWVNWLRDDPKVLRLHARKRESVIAGVLCVSAHDALAVLG
jgi:hypothetical protein